MVNVLKAILLDLPRKLAADAVEIVELSPYVDFLIYFVILAFFCVFLIFLSRILSIRS